MAEPTRVQILTHGYCFDGLVSAVLFRRLLDRVDARRPLAVGYRSCGYGPKLKSIPRGWLSGEVNAILDFRYVENDRLSYYFDHHKTGFASAEERAHAERRVAGSAGKRALHYDAECTSCAKLIARVSKDVYGVADEGLAGLVEWADRVDSARFDDPVDAFYAREPALVLADVVERHGDTKFLERWVPELCERSVEDIAASEEITSLAAPLAVAKETFLAAVKRAGAIRDDVAVVDLAEELLVPAGKFATYVAFPTCRYSVILLRTKDQLKLGIGFNPWQPKPRGHDISAICKREGGGGHPVVGAVNFAHEEMGRAREVMGRVVGELSGGG